MKWIFKISPVAASRPRVGKWGAYYSGAYKTFREEVIPVIKTTVPNDHVPTDRPIRVSVHFNVQKPKSTKLDYPKPDIDNFLKAALDQLNGVLWEDDQQIVELGHCLKRWTEEGEDPCFVVWVEEI